MMPLSKISVIISEYRIQKDLEPKLFGIVNANKTR